MCSKLIVIFAETFFVILRDILVTEAFRSFVSIVLKLAETVFISPCVQTF